MQHMYKVYVNKYILRNLFIDSPVCTLFSMCVWTCWPVKLLMCSFWAGLISEIAYNRPPEADAHVSINPRGGCGGDD